MLQTRTITREAPSVAALAHLVQELPREARVDITATENGRPWARLLVRPLTDSARSVFPLDRDGLMGDTRRAAQSGVMVRDGSREGLPVVIERARRMFAASIAKETGRPADDPQVAGLARALGYCAS